ncbi:MAG: methylmalonyl-CoA mutase family protein [Spirosomaceae bacterium]|jgi:methylmalonyl-CoA mutase|nr:methylmalonyl-CoA mutase family protein [Spirosomataceae bacterium]
MEKQLFDVFETTDKAAWQQQTLKDLKGKPLESLLWETDLGFAVQPYYTAEDARNALLPLLHDSQKKETGWLNQPSVVYTDEKTTNGHIIRALNGGADAILLDLAQANTSVINFQKLLHGIKLSDTPVLFRTNGLSKQVLASLQQFIAYHINGGLVDDALSRWMQTGDLAPDAFEQAAQHCRDTADSPHFRPLCIDGTVLHNAGANATQELAVMLATAVTYMDKLSDLGLSIAQIVPKIFFSVAVGTSYFVEIAKLRALRYLWAEIQRQWAFAPAPAYIHASNSLFYDAAITTDTNILRATTEAMSAVIGGCDALTIRAYDVLLKPSDDFSERIARNISTILKEESHLNKTTDPATGSYFIDALTLQLADAAWALFLEIEQKGGLMPAFEQNFIQHQIEVTYQRRLEALRQNQRIMVGVNKFRIEDSGTFSPFSITSPPSELPFSLLPHRRIAASFESV